MTAASLAILGIIPLKISRVQALLGLVGLILLGVALLAVLAAAVVMFVRAGAGKGLLMLLGGLLGLLLVVALLHQVAGPRRAANPTPVGKGAWTTFMGNARRTGNTDASAGPAVGEKVWTFRDGLAGAPFGGSAAVADGRVYVGSDSKKLYCLDARNGGVIWVFKAGEPIFASPVVAGGRVYVGEGLHETTSARVYCLDARDGGKRWEFPTTSHVEFAPTLDGGRLFVGAGGDGVYCLDAGSGRKLWQHPGVHVDASPAVAEGRVFFGNVYGQTAFHALAADTGQLLWKTPSPLGVCGSPSAADGRVCFGIGNGDFAASHARPAGGVWCLSAETGEVLWKTAGVGDAVLTTPAQVGGRVYFGSRDGKVYCLRAADGETVWAREIGQPVVSSPAVTAGRVFVGCDDGNVHCLNADDGRPMWRFDTSRYAFNPDAQVLASPAVAGGRVYVGSMNGMFFCIGAAEAGAGDQP